MTPARHTAAKDILNTAACCKLHAASCTLQAIQNTVKYSYTLQAESLKQKAESQMHKDVCISR